MTNGPSFLLRPWREGDQAALLRYANNRRIIDNVRDSFPNPYTPMDANWYIREAGRNDNQLNFAIDVAGQAVGSIAVVRQTDVHRVSAEIGYWLAEPFWGQGIATEAVRRIVPLAFAHWPTLERIYAGVFSHNPTSMRVLEKTGFVQEAILRRAVVKNDVVEDEYVFAIWRDTVMT